MEFCQVIAAGSVVAVSIVFFGNVSCYKVLKGLFLTAFLISVGQTMMYEYKREQAEYKADIADMPSECMYRSNELGFWMSIWSSVKSFFGIFAGNSNYCRKYRVMMHMEGNLIYKMTLTKAISITLTEFIVEPFGHVGTAFSKFFSNSFSELSWLAIIPAYIFLLIFVIAVALTLPPALFKFVCGFLQRYLFPTVFGNMGAQQNIWHQNAAGIAPHQAHPPQPLSGYNHCCCTKHVNHVQDLPAHPYFHPQNVTYHPCQPQPNLHTQHHPLQNFNHCCSTKHPNHVQDLPMHPYSRPQNVPYSLSQPLPNSQKHDATSDVEGFGYGGKVFKQTGEATQEWSKWAESRAKQSQMHLQGSLSKPAASGKNSERCSVEAGCGSIAQSLNLLNEGLENLSAFLTQTGSRELYLLMKASIKELVFESNGAPNGGIDVSDKLDVLDDCLAALGAHFEGKETSMFAILILTQMKDVTRKLRIQILNEAVIGITD